MGVSQYWGPPHHWTPPHHQIPNAGNDWLWSHLSNTNVKTPLYKTLTKIVSEMLQKSRAIFWLVDPCVLFTWVKWRSSCGKDSAEVFVRVSAQSIAGEELRQLRLGMLGAVEWPTRMREGRKGTIRNILEHLKMVTLKMALLQSECVFQTYFRGIPGLFVVEGSMEAVVVVSCNNYSWNIQVNLEIAKQSDVKTKNGDPVKT